MVERGGFEPPKAKPADLQSAPFDRFGTSPADRPRNQNAHRSTARNDPLFPTLHPGATEALAEEPCAQSSSPPVAACTACSTFAAANHSCIDFSPRCPMLDARCAMGSIVPIVFSIPAVVLSWPSSPAPRLWSWRWDSNPQPADYKSAALPVELRQLGDDRPLTIRGQAPLGNRLASGFSKSLRALTAKLRLADAVGRTPQLE